MPSRNCPRNVGSIRVGQSKTYRDRTTRGSGESGQEPEGHSEPIGSFPRGGIAGTRRGARLLPPRLVLPNKEPAQASYSTLNRHEFREDVTMTCTCVSSRTGCGGRSTIRRRSCFRNTRDQHRRRKERPRLCFSSTSRCWVAAVNPDDQPPRPYTVDISATGVQSLLPPPRTFPYHHRLRAVGLARPHPLVEHPTAHNDRARLRSKPTARVRPIPFRENSG